jgi:hypothetical protein
MRKIQNRNARRGHLWCARMSEETIAQRVIRVIAKNKKLALEELRAASRFDDLKMDSRDALNMIFAFNCRPFSS